MSVKSLAKYFAIVFLLVVIIALAIYGYNSYRISNETKKIVDETIQTMRTVGSVQYEDISVNPLNGFVSIEALQLVPFVPGATPITVDDAHVKLDKNEAGFFTLIKADLKGVRTRLDLSQLDPEIAVKILKLPEHMRNIVVDLDIEYQFKPKLNKALLKLESDQKGVGQMSFGAVTSAEFVSNPLSVMTNGLTLYELEFFYVDDGFVSAVMDLVVEESGLSQQDFIAQAEQAMALELSALDDPYVEDIITKIFTFIKNPKTIAYEFKPAQPLNLMELYIMGMQRDPVAIMKRMNFKLTVNQ